MEDQIKGLKINSAGYGTIAKLAMQDKRLHVYAKAIYAYFCSFTGGGDTCFPSRDKICFDLGIAKTSYQKYLRQLVQNGYIIVEQQKNNGVFSHNIYTLKDVIDIPAADCETVHGVTAHGATEHDVTAHGEVDTNNNSSNNNNTNNNISKKERKFARRFIPPTVDEVRLFCIERRNNVDAQRFVDFYTAKGWKVGKNPMVDWKAAVRTWESRSASTSCSNNCGNNNPEGFEEAFDLFGGR